MILLPREQSEPGDLRQGKVGEIEPMLFLAEGLLCALFVPYVLSQSICCRG